MSTYTGVTNFQKTVRFFWLTLYWDHKCLILANVQFKVWTGIPGNENCISKWSKILGVQPIFGPSKLLLGTLWVDASDLFKKLNLFLWALNNSFTSNITVIMVHNVFDALNCLGVNRRAV